MDINKKQASLHPTKLVIDNDLKLKYENRNIVRSLINNVLIQTMQRIPHKISNFLLRKSSEKANKVNDYKTTHHALDVLYSTGIIFNFRFNFLSSIMEHIWFNFDNPKSVRNRLKLVRKILYNTIKLNDEKKLITIFSLASGSARAVIKTARKLHNYNIKVKLLDKNPMALEVSKQFLENNKIDKKNFTFINDNVRNFDKYCSEKQINIIEMVGLMDYLSDDKAVLILTKIYKSLSKGGVLVTANIRNNHERNFLDKVIKWEMIYREPEDLSRVLIKAGFKAEHIIIYYEPLLIHGVALAVK